MKVCMVVIGALLLCGCANLNKSEQRMVSGADTGDVIAGPIGAGVGAGIGYVLEKTEKK